MFMRMEVSAESECSPGKGETSSYPAGWPMTPATSWDGWSWAPGLTYAPMDSIANNTENISLSAQSGWGLAFILLFHYVSEFF